MKLKKYEAKYTETVTKTVEIEAKNQNEANDIISTYEFDENKINPKNCSVDEQYIHYIKEIKH